MRRYIVAAACAVALGFGVGACGGDDAGPPNGQNVDPSVSTPNSVRNPGGTTGNSVQQNNDVPGGTLPERSPGPVDGAGSTAVEPGGSGGIGTPGG